MADNEEKQVVSVYISKPAKKRLDAMAEALTHTKQGRSVTLDVLINFGMAHFVNLEFWYQNKLKESEDEKMLHIKIS